MKLDETPPVPGSEPIKVPIKLDLTRFTTLRVTINIEEKDICKPCLDPGDICFVYDIQTPTDNNQCVGVEFDGTYFYITGGGGTTHPDTNYVYFFDKNGKLLDLEFHDRIMAIPFKQIKRIEKVIVVAGGEKKVEAIEGALKGGFTNVLITDEPTANKVISMRAKVV